MLTHTGSIYYLAKMLREQHFTNTEVFAECHGGGSRNWLDTLMQACCNERRSLTERTKMLDETTHYNLLKALAENPGLSQRDMAKRLGVSLGKINYCLNALLEKGSIKINNFRNSNNKPSYVYLLTPCGVEQKARMTVAFLQCKVREYERLRIEIEELKHEAEQKGLLEHAYK